MKHKKPTKNFGAPHRPMPEEGWEFARAMEALKKRLGRQPTLPEVLAEARRLGYRRQG